MPTKNHAKVRLLLKYGKAKVIKRTPFTIQLLSTSKTYRKHRKTPPFRAGDIRREN